MKRTVFIVFRIAVPLAILAAIVGQLMTSFSNWSASGITNTDVTVTSFFSFFTIDSNVFSMLLLPVGAYLLARNLDDPRWFAVARLSVVTYMVTTGVVYNLLLRNVELPQGSTLGWSNEILHVVAPLYLLIDWLFAPGRIALPWKSVGIVVIFPLVWSVYTLVRGPLVEDQLRRVDYWYPYPFLNPETSANGYATVAAYLAVITVIIAGVAFGAVAVSRRSTRGS